jgi:hypothetical protein
MKLHPPYKEVARFIAESSKDFFTYKQIAEMLEVELNSQDFQIQRMHLKSHTLDEFDIDLIPTANEHLGRGYKKATDDEKVEITAPRLTRRIFNATRKQRKVLTTVDTGLLSEAARLKFERNMVKNLSLISFLQKTPLRKCVPGMTVSVGTPKVYKRLISKLHKPDTEG